MSTILRVSYEEPYELDRIVKQLEPLVKEVKKQPAKGKYLLAYIQLVYFRKDKLQSPFSD